MNKQNELPKGWCNATLGEITLPKSDRVNPADCKQLPFIGLEHVEAHTMHLLGTVAAETMKSSAARFKPRDVLYARLRPYLNKVYRPDFEGLSSAEFIVLSETALIFGGFLQYRLNSGDFVSFASHLNTGDRPRVDFDQLRNGGGMTRTWHGVGTLIPPDFAREG